MQLKYARRKMLLRNAVNAGNCSEFTDLTTLTSTVIPFSHKRKHSTPLRDKDNKEKDDKDTCSNTEEEQQMVGRLDQSQVNLLPTYCTTLQGIMYKTSYN